MRRGMVVFVDVDGGKVVSRGIAYAFWGPCDLGETTSAWVVVLSMLMVVRWFLGTSRVLSACPCEYWGTTNASSWFRRQ